MSSIEALDGDRLTAEAIRRPEAVGSSTPPITMTSSARGRRAVLRGGALVIGSTLTWHLSNFLFNATAAHLLGPTGYGTVAAAVALLYLFSPLFVAIQTVACRTATALDSAGQRDRIAPLLKALRLRLTGLGVLIAGAVSLSSPALAGFLHVSSAVPLALLSLALGAWALTHLQRGVLQGLMAFERYALSTIIEGLSKVLVAGVVLLVIWRGVDGAMLAFVGSAAVALVSNWRLLRFLPRSSVAPVRVVSIGGYSVVTFAYLSLLAVLLAVDVLAAKRYLGAHAAGLYASISLAGKIVFYASSALSVWLFPLFSAEHDRGGDARTFARRGLSAVLAASAVLIIAFFAIPEAVIDPLFGHRFAAAAGYLGPAGAVFAAYAVAYLAATYLLSQRRWTGAVVLAGAVLADLSGLYMFHSSSWDLLGVQGAVFTLAAVGLVALALRRHEVTNAPR